MRPEDVLPDQVDDMVADGLPVRKGSVAAFLANARVLGDADAPAAEREQARLDLIALVPAMVALHVFEVFSIRDRSVAALVERVIAGA